MVLGWVRHGGVERGSALLIGKRRGDRLEAMLRKLGWNQGWKAKRQKI